MNKGLLTSLGICILIALGCTEPIPQSDHIPVRIAVLNFDPTVGDSTLHARFGWSNPRSLADRYVETIKEVSQGAVQMDIVSWSDENRFPIKTDSFEYSLEEFSTCWEDRTTCHDPDGTDYERLLREYDIVSKIDAREFDELWIFGAPYMGFWESSMAGPHAFYINGGVFDSVAASRPFVIMGFSYERGLAEMLHNLCHRTEATMEKVSGGWDTTDLSTDWARFAANAQQSGGVAAVGSCHYPPNGTTDYEYDNPNPVESNAEGWFSYPNVGLDLHPVNKDTWGGPEYHLNYMKWWFTHLPNGSRPEATASIQPEKLSLDSTHTASPPLLTNWWKYVFEFEKYVIDGPKESLNESEPMERP